MENTLTETINSLTPGDVIIIHQGEGSPPVKREPALIVWRVGPGYVLTTDGTLINRDYNSEVIKTGARGKIIPTLEAQTLWAELISKTDDILIGAPPESEPE